MARSDVLISIGAKDQTLAGLQSVSRNFNRTGNLGKRALGGLSRQGALAHAAFARATKGVTLLGRAGNTLITGPLLAMTTALAGVTGAVQGFRDSADRITEIGSAANAAGIAVDWLYAVTNTFAGTKFSEGYEIIDLVKELTVKANDAANGSEDMAAAWKVLGINFEAFQGLSPEAKLTVFAEAILKAKDQTAALAAADEIAGDAAVEFAQALQAKNIAVGDLGTKTSDLSQKTVNAVEKMKLQWGLMRLKVKETTDKIVGQFALWLEKQTELASEGKLKINEIQTAWTGLRTAIEGELGADVWEKIKTKWNEAWQNMWTQLAATIIRILAALTAWTPKVSQWVQDNQEHIDKLAGYWDKIREKLVGVKDKLPSIWAHIAKGAGIAWAAIKFVVDGIGATWKILRTTLQTVRAGLKGEWDLVVANIGGAASGILTRLNTITFDKLPEALTKAKDKLEPLWEKIETRVKTAWTTTATNLGLFDFALIGKDLATTEITLEEAWTRIEDRVGTAWTAIKANLQGFYWLYLRDGLVEARTQLNAQWTLISDRVSLVWTTVRSRLEQWDIKTILGKALEVTRARLAELWTLIADRAGLVWNRVKGYLEQWQIKDLLESKLKDAQARLAELWTLITDRVGLAWGTVKTKLDAWGITEIVEPILRTAHEDLAFVWGLIETRAETAWTNIKSGLEQWDFSDIPGSLSGIKEEWNLSWDGYVDIVDSNLASMIRIATRVMTSTLPNALRVGKVAMGVIWQGIARDPKDTWTAIKTELQSWDFGDTEAALQEARVALSAQWTLITDRARLAWNSVKGSLATWTFQALQTALTTTRTAMAVQWSLLSDRATRARADVMASIKAWTFKSIEVALSGLKTALSGIWTLITDRVRLAWNTVKLTLDQWSFSAIEVALTGLKTALSSIWGQIETRVSTARTTVESKLSGIDFGGIAGNLSSVKTRLDTLFGDIETRVSTAVTRIQQSINSIIAAYNSIPVLPDVKVASPASAGPVSYAPPSQGVDWTRSFASSREPKRGIFGGIVDWGKSALERLKRGPGERYMDDLDSEGNWIRGNPFGGAFGGGGGTTTTISAVQGPQGGNTTSIPAILRQAQARSTTAEVQSKIQAQAAVYQEIAASGVWDLSGATAKVAAKVEDDVEEISQASEQVAAVTSMRTRAVEDLAVASHTLGILDDQRRQGYNSEAKAKEWLTQKVETLNLAQTTLALTGDKLYASTEKANEGIGELSKRVGEFTIELSSTAQGMLNTSSRYFTAGYGYHNERPNLAISKAARGNLVRQSWDPNVDGDYPGRRERNPQTGAIRTRPRNFRLSQQARTLIGAGGDSRLVTHRSSRQHAGTAIKRELTVNVNGTAITTRGLRDEVTNIVRDATRRGILN